MRLVRLYAAAVLIPGLLVAAAWGWAVTRPEPVDPRSQVMCMDDPGGGIYCWKPGAGRTTGVPQPVAS